MLYLNPPYHIINGVTLFADHANPRQYYYAPLAPHLTERLDPASGIMVPQIQLIKFRGEAGSGGFLNFDVNLGISQEALDDIAVELRNSAQLDEMPMLAPIPWVDGRVKMMLFGKQSPTNDDNNTNTTVNPNEPQFVLKIDHHAKPALYGNNQAAFSVRLDQAGVTVVEEALQGQMSPIGIVYELEYLGLRPAYAVNIVADWDRVYEHFSEEKGFDFFVASAEIEEVVDELVENQIIDIQIDTFLAGDDASGVISRRDRIITEIKDMVIKSFFEPSLDPLSEKEDGWDKAVDTFESVLAASHSHGGGLKYKKLELTRIDRKSLNVRMNERIAVKRAIFPQAHLRGLAADIANGVHTLDDFVLPVDLDDPWFERREVQVISRADFAADNIASINVTLSYEGDAQNAILDAQNPDASVSWLSVLDNGEMVDEVTASYRVAFKDVNTAERPLMITAPATTLTTQNLEIFPRELYNIISVPIVPRGVDWEKYSLVEVHLRYSDPDNNIQQRDTMLFDKDTDDQTWKLFVLDPARTTFEYKLIYRAIDHGDEELEWAVAENEQLTIRDFSHGRQRRQLTVQPAVNWDEINTIFVDLTYDDAGNNIFETQTFQFDANAKEAQTFTVALANPDLRLVQYKATILFKDGRFVELPDSTTLAPRIFIRADMRGHRIVRVQPEAIPFDLRNVTRMDVMLRFNDEIAGLAFNDTITFDSSADLDHFEYDFIDEQRASYEFRTTYQFENGLSRSTEWADSNETLLTIPVG